MLMQDTPGNQLDDELTEHDIETHTAGVGKVTVHQRYIGHNKAVTSVFFSALEDVLVSMSCDRSIRFWGVDNGTDVCMEVVVYGGRCVPRERQDTTSGALIIMLLIATVVSAEPPACSPPSPQDG
eukprot:GHVU01139259.1.p2 GENE.GHVU01139259.1~~GHVU01139259.1.p2  ORF type:complete len:125 (-),score=15.55 GHVU01139259.1:381-755(-)